MFATAFAEKNRVPATDFFVYPAMLLASREYRIPAEVATTGMIVMAKR